MSSTATLTPDIEEIDERDETPSVGPVPAGRPALTAAELDQLGEALDAIRDEILDDLGQRDADYIRDVVRLQRALEVSGRVMLMAGFLPPAFLGGVTALSLSKILDNMEIGHNVLHGQYDWMQDPSLDSATFDWDHYCSSEQWRHSHNYLHHTFTNVRGKDRDIGYGILRMTDEQRWRPTHLANPVAALILAVQFQWGVALHDVEIDQVLSGKKPVAEAREELSRVWEKARTQVLKDYALYPALAGPMAPVVLAGNVSSNLVRNLWTFAVIFCGHFPAGVATFSE
ncbi:hypothetical protein BH24ACT4_BH24ACT4_03680 [soil metagenome]